MASIRCARTSSVEIEANRIHSKAPLISAAAIRNVVQLFAITLGAASLAACAQSSVVTQKSELHGASRQVSLEHSRRTSPGTIRRVAVTKKHTPFASHKNAGETSCLAWSGQLLHGRYPDRERRKIRYARIDCSSSYIAIRHPVARDKCCHWTVRDGSRERPWSVRSRTSCRRLVFRGRNTGNGWWGYCEGQT